MIEPTLQIGGGNWANKSDSLLGYHKDGANFYADELTFSRNSLGSYTDTNGLIQSMPYNLLQQSNTFSTIWVNTNSTDTGGQADKDGTSNAWLLQSTIASGEAYLRQTISASGSNTFSIYAKAGTANFLGIYINATSGADPLAYFNLSTGEVGTTNATASIVSVGSGWYRCSVAYNATIANIDVYVTTADGSFLSTTGNNIYIQDAQLNSGSTALPYFATTTRLNLARVDYKDNINGSLLLEGQRTNLLTYSEQFDNGAWDKNTLTIGANATTSPDGTQNADNLIPTTSSGYHYALQSISFPAGANTASCYAKASGYDWFVLDMGGSNGFAYFNVTTGVVGTTGSGATASIQSVGNGWYRCVVTFTFASLFNSYILVSVRNADNGGGFVGNGTSGIYIYGAQTEQGSYSTSYIKSEGAATTRLADAALTSSVPSLIGQTEGVMFVDFNRLNTAASSWYSISNIAGTTAVSYANSVYFYQIPNDIFVAEVYSGNVRQVAFSGSGLSVGRHKIAFGYKANDFVCYIDGVQIGTDTSGSVPAMNYLTIGGAADPVPTNDSINQALLFKTRLTNAELATLTTL